MARPVGNIYQTSVKNKELKSGWIKSQDKDKKQNKNHDSGFA